MIDIVFPHQYLKIMNWNSAIYKVCLYLCLVVGFSMNEGLAQMGHIIQRPPVEVRIRSLMALANLFSVRVSVIYISFINNNIK